VGESGVIDMLSRGPGPRPGDRAARDGLNHWAGTSLSRSFWFGASTDGSGADLLSFSNRDRLKIRSWRRAPRLDLSLKAFSSAVAEQTGGHREIWDAIMAGCGDAMRVPTLHPDESNAASSWVDVACAPDILRARFGSTLSAYSEIPLLQSRLLLELAGSAVAAGFARST
jgi:hypothetical protein